MGTVPPASKRAIAGWVNPDAWASCTARAVLEPPRLPMIIEIVDAGFIPGTSADTFDDHRTRNVIDIDFVLHGDAGPALADALAQGSS